MPHFTKGEWEVVKHNDDSGYTIKSIGRIVAKIPFTVPNENTTHEADARLIAAAPDLYNNVKALLHDITLNDECRVHGEIRELAGIIADIDGNGLSTEKDGYSAMIGITPLSQSS